jgi:membrane associated rhomboid family serine protease
VLIPLRDLNPVRRRPLVTHALLAANLALFAYQVSLSRQQGELFAFRYGVVPYFLAEDFHAASLSTPFTSMFLHNGFGHLLTNMWYLHLFADNVEDALGKLRFLAFYLACGLAAAAAHVFVDPESRIPMIGASGAISGVLGAYLRLFPFARVITLVLIFVRELPALIFIVIWFAVQLFNGVGSLGHAETGEVAFFAHVGGFVAGLLLIGGMGKIGGIGEHPERESDLRGAEHAAGRRGEYED